MPSDCETDGECEAYTPYTPGDVVEIRIADDDLDSQYNGVTCEIIDDTTDDLDTLTGNEKDKHHYAVRDVETGEQLPIDFRHDDLTLCNN